MIDDQHMIWIDLATVVIVALLALIAHAPPGRLEDASDRSPTERQGWADPLVWITVLLVAVGAIQAYTLYTTDRTLQATLVASNRAWISVARAKFQDEPVANRPLAYYVFYGNTGKEPARGLVAQEEQGLIDPLSLRATVYELFERADPKPNDKLCDSVHPDNSGSPVFPSGPYDFPYFRVTNKTLSDDVIAGKKVVYVHGCFAYTTSWGIGKTEYCFLLWPLSLRDNDPTIVWPYSAGCPRWNNAF